MRILLWLALLSLLPHLVMASGFGGGVWRGKNLHVYDYSPNGWGNTFEQTVMNAGAILPDRAPRLVYHRMPASDCADVPLKKNAIVICRGDISQWPPFLHKATAMTWYPTEKRRIKWARVEVRNESGSVETACHELIGHALLGLDDDYNSKSPAESCIHADATKPGTWDQAVARWLYKKFDEPRKRTRH